MKYKAFRAGCKITEAPVVFPDRIHGTSKMPASYFFKALIDVVYIRYLCMSTGLKQFIKFGITGGLGAITNLLIFFIMADKAGLPVIPVSIGCFVIAGTQNYIINHKWSFANITRNDGTGKSVLTVKKWFIFLCSALAGLLINITVMKFILNNINVSYKFIAQACGIAAGMAVNFICSKFIVFRRLPI